MLLKLINAAFGIAAAILLVAGPAAAQTLDKIKQRGVLVVGSKADYKPFGFRDPAGNIVGFEPDLGRDVAERLAVKLELEPVVSSNRMQFLQQGKIDLMIATMNDTPERRKRRAELLCVGHQCAGEPEGRVQAMGAAQGSEDLRHPGCLVQQDRGGKIRRRDRRLQRPDRGGDRAAARELRRLAL
jgi:hypothetical protein